MREDLTSIQADPIEGSQGELIPVNREHLTLSAVPDSHRVPVQLVGEKTCASS